MFIKQGKKSRNELQLPILHFVVVDDWQPKLGKSFDLWLKLHTLADRSDSDRKFDIVPRSMVGLAEYLGISKNTLLSRVRPLWEFGLIDIIEYEKSEMLGSKPKNIVVYEFPKNDRTLATAPLEKCRDWKTDYSESVHFGGLRGTVQKNERGSVQKIERGGVQKIEHNNVSNSINNDSNSINNDSNQDLDPNDVYNLDLPMPIKKIINKFGLGRGHGRNDIKIDEIVSFYHTSPYIDPAAGPNDYDFLNVYEFVNVLGALINNAKTIERSTYGILNSWVLNRLSMKKDDVLGSSTSINANSDLYYNWLEE